MKSSKLLTPGFLSRILHVSQNGVDHPVHEKVRAKSLDYLVKLGNPRWIPDTTLWGRIFLMKNPGLFVFVIYLLAAPFLAYAWGPQGLGAYTGNNGRMPASGPDDGSTTFQDQVGEAVVNYAWDRVNSTWNGFTEGLKKDWQETVVNPIDKTISGALGQTYQAALSHSDLANGYQSNGQYDLAAKEWQTAIFQYHNLEDEKNVNVLSSAQDCRLVAQSYWNLGLRDGALAAYGRMSDLAEAAGDEDLGQEARNAMIGINTAVPSDALDQGVWVGQQSGQQAQVEDTLVAYNNYRSAPQGEVGWVMVYRTDTKEMSFIQHPDLRFEENSYINTKKTQGILPSQESVNEFTRTVRSGNLTNATSDVLEHPEQITRGASELVNNPQQITQGLSGLADKAKQLSGVINDPSDDIKCVIPLTGRAVWADSEDLYSVIQF